MTVRSSVESLMPTFFAKEKNPCGCKNSLDWECAGVELCSIDGFAPSRRLMRIGGGIKADLVVCSKVSTPQLIGILDRPPHRWTLFCDLRCTRCPRKLLNSDPWRAIATRLDHSSAKPTRAAVSILVRTDPKHLEGLMGAARPAISELGEFYWNSRLRAQAEPRICSSTGLAIVVNFAERRAMKRRA